MNALWMGLAYKQCAGNLKLSVNTVKVHVSRALDKLDASSTLEAFWKFRNVGCPKCSALNACH